MIIRVEHKPNFDFLASDDRDLLSRTFDIDDPSTLAGLLDHPPNTDEVPEIEFTYDLTPPGGRKAGHAPNLECVFRHSARHWKGYVVRWKSGARARLGGTCGAEHFGFVFDEVEQRFDGARSRKGDLKKFIALRALLPEVVSELRALPRHQSIIAYDTYRQNLRTDFPELHHALGVIARLDGQLLTTRQERDHNAEHDRAHRSEEGRKLFQALEDAPRKGPGVVKACNHRIKQWLSSQQPIMKTVTQDAGPLAGGAILTDPRPLTHIASTATITMVRLADEITGNRSDHWNSAHPFSTTFKAIRDATGAADQIVRLLKELIRFTENANLGRVAIWTAYEIETMRPRVPHAVTARGRQLTCDKDGVSLTLPADFVIPTLAKLQELRELM